MNHAEYQKSLKTKTFAELQFIMRDCNETIQTWAKSGERHPNEGYYQDEISYCGMEMKKRQSV